MTTSPTPGLEATSPLGMSPGAPVAQTGIPLGATALASPGSGLLVSQLLTLYTTPVVYLYLDRFSL